MLLHQWPLFQLFESALNLFESLGEFLFSKVDKLLEGWTLRGIWKGSKEISFEVKNVSVLVEPFCQGVEIDQRYQSYRVFDELLKFFNFSRLHLREFHLFDDLDWFI